MTTKNDSTVLVVGGTGTVGGATVRELLRRGGRVRALVRSKARAAGLVGAELVEGDVRDLALLERCLVGVHTAFYVSPHEVDEEVLAENFISSCERAGVRLVFVGVHIDAKWAVVRTLLRLYFGRVLPTYVAKLRISERARTSQTNSVVLMPSNFMDNDEMFRDAIEKGQFLQPFERPFNRVAVQDIAEAAARVCLDRHFPAGAYPIVGPESLDGPACAQTWSEALGRPVAYCVDEEAFRAALTRTARGKKVTDVIASYAAIRNIEIPTSQKDLARTIELLGRHPTSYAAYVRAGLRAEGSAA